MLNEQSFSINVYRMETSVSKSQIISFDNHSLQLYSSLIHACRNYKMRYILKTTGELCKSMDFIEGLLWIYEFVLPFLNSFLCEFWLFTFFDKKFLQIHRETYSNQNWFIRRLNLLWLLLNKNCCKCHWVTS